MTRCVDELLFHWPAVVKKAPEGFAKNFARSIAKQSRRRRWEPTEKQRRIMERFVADLFCPDDDAVIE